MSTEMTGAKPAQNHGGNPDAPDAALTHGFYRAQALLERGLRVIPENSPLYPVVCEFRNEITADLGGESNLSKLQRDLIDQYLTTQILISSVDHYLVSLEHPRVSKKTGRQLAPLGIVEKRSHKFRPILNERNRLVETSLKLAAAIGLERVPAPVRETCPVCRQDCMQRQTMTGKSELVCIGCNRFPLQCACATPSETANVHDNSMSQEIQATDSEAAAE